MLVHLLGDSLVTGWVCLPVLFELMFLRAVASASAICDSRCLSLFCSMSSCSLRPRMAFLGASRRF